MQKCQKCSKQFTWKNIIKSKWFLVGYKPMECDSCHTKHYVSTTTRWIYSILTIGVPLLLFYYSRTRQMQIWGLDPITRGNITSLGSYYLLVYLLWVGLIVYITPYFARYHKR